MGALKMIAHLSQLILLLSSVAVAQESTRLVGHFGKERIRFDVWFGENVMLITSHKRGNEHPAFSETSNLHIFKQHMVAMRNTLKKECYIKKFNATMDEMKDKVKYALKNNGDLEVKEERLELGGMQPLGSDVVDFFLPPKIAEFCRSHDVYLIGGGNIRQLDPKEISPQRRGRRDVPVVSGGVGGFAPPPPTTGGYFPPRLPPGGPILPPRPRLCPCNGVYNSGRGRSSKRRPAAGSQQGFVADQAGSAFAPRPQWCPCRNRNDRRRPRFRPGRRRPRCPQMCPCPVEPTDVLIVC